MPSVRSRRRRCEVSVLSSCCPQSRAKYGTDGLSPRLSPKPLPERRRRDLRPSTPPQRSFHVKPRFSCALIHSVYITGTVLPSFAAFVQVCRRKQNSDLKTVFISEQPTQALRARSRVGFAAAGTVTAMSDLTGLHAQAKRLILMLREGLEKLEATEVGSAPPLPAAVPCLPRAQEHEVTYFGLSMFAERPASRRHGRPPPGAAKEPGGPAGAPDGQWQDTGGAGAATNDER